MKTEGRSEKVEGRAGGAGRAGWAGRVRRGGRVAVVAGLFILLGSNLGRLASSQDAPPLWDTGTFSILGYAPATREVGGAVQSRVFSVGNGVLWADADSGIAATQAIVDVGYGPKALALLAKGLRPD